MSPAGAAGCSDQELAHLTTLFDLRRWADVVAFGTPMMSQDIRAAECVIHALWMQGQPSAARAQLTRARELFADSARLHVYAAHLACDIGLTSLAEREARAGLHIAPDNLALTLVLAKAIWMKGDTHGAQQTARQAAALHPSSFAVHHLLALFAVRSGDTAKARWHLSHALKFEPNHPDGLALMAELVAAQDSTHAAALLQSSLRVEPSNRRRQLRLRQLGPPLAAWSIALGSVPLVGWALWHQLSAVTWIAVGLFSAASVRLLAPPARTRELLVLAGLFGAALFTPLIKQGLDTSSDGVTQQVWPSVSAVLAVLILSCGFAFTWLFGARVLRSVILTARVSADWLREAWQASRMVGLRTLFQDVWQRPWARLVLRAAAVSIALALLPMPPLLVPWLQGLLLPPAILAMASRLPTRQRPGWFRLVLWMGFGPLMVGTLVFAAQAGSAAVAQWPLQLAWSMACALYTLFALNHISAS